MPRTKPKKPKSEKAPSPKVVIDTSSEGDQAFLEAMQAFEATRVPVKDQTPPSPPGPAKSAGGRKTGKGAAGPLTIDLHGLTLREAKDVVIARLESQLAASRGGIIHIRIITGKGLRSGQGIGVLAREVHAIVRNHFYSSIHQIDDAPADVTVGGLPIRGHFDVWLRTP